MRNGNRFWSIAAACGAVAAAFIWLRNNPNRMPKWMKQPMEQMNKMTGQATDAFNPQS
ncbi:MAG: hypothetical protein LKI94_09340 [Sporolactobacillus sp.]|nr:hypothetical protein [Sporolactobacillus sp.]MCI1882382.1 hypothetical protein [Sporolactobacillus sp.]